MNRAQRRASASSSASSPASPPPHSLGALPPEQARHLQGELERINEKLHAWMMALSIDSQNPQVVGALGSVLTTYGVASLLSVGFSPEQLGSALTAYAEQAAADLQAQRPLRSFVLLPLTGPSATAAAQSAPSDEEAKCKDD